MVCEGEGVEGAIGEGGRERWGYEERDKSNCLGS